MRRFTHRNSLQWIKHFQGDFNFLPLSIDCRKKRGEIRLATHQIVADGKIYIPSRWNGVLVLAAKPKYEVLAQNRFASDESDFNATPAICGRDVILRSNRFLYCVSESKPR